MFSKIKSYRHIDKIPYLLLFLLSLYPILKEALTSILMVLFVVSTVVVYGADLKTNINRLGCKPIFINTGFYLFLIVSCLYSTSVVGSLQILQPTYLLLVFPVIVFYFIPKVNQKIIDFFSYGFIFANFVLVIYFFNILVEGLHIDRFPDLLDKSVFYKIETIWKYPYEFALSKAERHLKVIYEPHKVYLSLNFLIAILLAFRLIFYRKKPVLLKTVLLLLSLLFMVSIVYTQALVSVLTLASFLLIFPFVQIKKKKWKLLYIAVFTIFLGIFFNTKAATLYENKNTDSAWYFFKYLATGDTHNGIDSRAYIYDCAIKLIKKNPLLGYGVGDVQDQLNACYQANNYNVNRSQFELEVTNINSHNYYFNLLLSGGIVCFSLFIYLLYNNIKRSITYKDYSYLFFLMIIIINLTTENLLVRIYGVVPFVLFNTLFFARLNAIQSKNDHNEEF